VRRSLTAPITVVMAILAAAGLSLTGAAAPQAGTQQAFRADPFWPKPLQQSWLLGSVTGVAVDSRDRIWVVHRGMPSFTARTEIGLATNPPTAELCCRPAPQVLAFDQTGAVVASWGGPGQGYEWPTSPGGIDVDAGGHVWITAAGPPEAPGGGRGRGGAAGPPPPEDAHVLKFTSEGKFVLQIGQAGKPGAPDSTTGLRRPAGVDVDTATNEVFVADAGNRRVVVFDATTGAYKRHWGAYGQPPGEALTDPYDPSAPPAKQFRGLSCVRVARDGMVYVCDRQNNRVQVFRRDGTFVSEAVVSKATRGNGAAWDLAFSTDAQQRQVFVADGQDQRVFILDRATLQVASSFGNGGRWPGTFYGVGSVAVDSKGNVYTGEALEGKRVQKFERR